jgi:predicted lipoprotein
LVVVLLVAMALNTKFLTRAELAAARPERFDAAATSQQLFEQATAELPGRAREVAEVVPALQRDVKAAAETYKAVSPNEGAFVFPVKTTATVTRATPDLLQLKVPGLDSPTPILVPLGVALNGSVIRDAMGFKFADAPGQSDYQFVGDELKKRMQAAVKPVADGSLQGKKVTVVGAISQLDTGAPAPAAKPVNIQPISLQVAR